jgi:DUF4097 and DUF4098 domain-containing protein YvlB
MRARAAIVIAALALPLAAAAALADPIYGYLHSEDSTSLVRGHVTSVKVDGDVSNVTVVPGDVTKVAMHLKWNNDRPSVTISVANGVLSVKARCADNVLHGPYVYVGGVGDCVDDLQLTVPSSAGLNVLTSSSIHVTQLTGTVDLRGSLVQVTKAHVPYVHVSATGQVTLDTVTSPTIQVGNSNGSIFAKNITSRSVGLNTSYGAVTVAGATARSLSASSGQGAVSAEKVKATLVDLSSSYGSIRVMDVASPDVSAMTDQGTVSVARLRGDRLTAKSGYGSVLVSETAARRVSAASDQGEVNVALTTQPDLARAVSHYGTVALGVPHGRYAVDASTSYGQRTVTGLVVDETAPRQLIARSDQGDVNVRGV